MTDIPNRPDLEAELSNAFAKLSARHKRRLLSLLGNPPNLGNVPLSFWEETAAELNGSLLPLINKIAIDSAERLVMGLPIGVDWALVNERAAQWANQYTFELVRNINNSSRRAVQEAISSYFDRGLSIGDLEKRLVNIFGPVRAEMIAVTEVTRAASEGEQLLAKEIANEGIEMVPVWQTNNDELVCPICGPRHNKPIENGEYPPAHPRCRCWVNHELPRRRHG